MSNSLRVNDRKIRIAFLERCYDEGLDPTEILEAWLRRAVRQANTVRPMSETEERVVHMRRKG